MLAKSGINMKLDNFRKILNETPFEVKQKVFLFCVSLYMTNNV